MKTLLPRRSHRASAARMFMLFFGGLVLAGLLLLAMTAVVKKKGVPAKKPVPAATNTVSK